MYADTRPEAVERFERKFEEMWGREGNALDSISTKLWMTGGPYSPILRFVGGERASTARRRLAGKICCRCGISLPSPFPEGGGERHCEKCQPRAHRVLMTFQQHAVWDLRFLEEDCQTVVGRRFDVPDDRELFELAERGGANVTEIRQSIARWNKGSAWLSLTEQQYRRLRGQAGRKR